MKKILFIFAFVIFAVACNHSTADISKIKVGMTGEQLKVIMDSPSIIDVQSDEEVWHYKYDDGYVKKITIQFKNDTIRKIIIY